MDPYIKDNTLCTTIERGLPFELVFDSPDLDLSQYDTITADFKPSRDLQAPPLISVELGKGIIVTPAGEDMEGEPVPSTISIEVPSTVTAKIRYEKLYMDIKARIEGGEPVRLLSAVCDILGTVSDI